MQIKELYLKNFGKFSDRTFLIEDGINVFYGENEFGKSTIYAFIRGMFFGMERARGRASKNDIFSQYEPWDNPNYYAGVMRFTSGGKNFRIERSFDKITKSASLICEDDGEELSLEQGDLDVLLDGLTAVSFDNTIAIGQLCSQPNQELAAELKNYAANYYESGDSEIDVQQALDTLKARQRAVDHQIKQEIAKKEHLRSRIEQEYDYVKRDLEKLKNEEWEAKSAQTEEAVSEPPEEEIPVKPELRLNRRMAALILAVMVLMIAAEGALLFYLADSAWKPVWAVASVVLDVLLLWRAVRFAVPKNNRKKELGSGDSSEKAEPQVQRRRWELGRIRANIHEKQVRLNNLSERLEELEASGFEVTQTDKKKQAIVLAQETIAQLSSEIVKGFGSTLNEKASEIISAITDGKYEKLYIDEKLNMFLLTREKRIPIERLSRGTIEQIYFALRMAAVDVLYEEDFPVILDDTFVYYDEERLRCVLTWLRSQKRQVVLFTCQKREIEILKKEEIPFHMN
ncbi:MAG: AAA family ATPase [Hespellia sp.]|nr:AAA family ATPase [Hespellia sp.]